MTEYTDFPKDFVNRTKANLKKYIGEYDVTNIINNSLGLIIIPHEHLIDALPNYIFSEIDKKYGINIRNIHYEKDKNYSLKNIIKHIRNGLAHGRIEQMTRNKEISGIRIYDKKNKYSKENFSICFTTEEFKQFAILISEEFLRK